jgi:hypothetical protein
MEFDSTYAVACTGGTADVNTMGADVSDTDSDSDGYVSMSEIVDLALEDKLTKAKLHEYSLKQQKHRRQSKSRRGWGSKKYSTIASGSRQVIKSIIDNYGLELTNSMIPNFTDGGRWGYSRNIAKHQHVGFRHSSNLRSDKPKLVMREMDEKDNLLKASVVLTRYDRGESAMEKRDPLFLHCYKTMCRYEQFTPHACFSYGYYFHFYLIKLVYKMDFYP